MKKKKVVIVFSLVNESTEVKNEEIEEDIMDELSEAIVPWCKRVEEIVVEG
jgi:hypothetical protein